MNKEPVIIGIGGGSGSGKTWMSERLQLSLQPLSAVIIHMDSYYLRSRPNGISPTTGRVYDDFNHPEAIHVQGVIERLEGVIEEKRTDVVIVEGFLALYFPMLCDWMDIKLYVDCQPDERLLRRLDRFKSELGHTYEETATEYLDLVRYRHEQFVEPTKWMADLIINGSMHPETGLNVIVKWTEQALQARASKRIAENLPFD